MANLISKGAFGALLPISHGAVTLTECADAPVTWVAPLKGQSTGVEAALQNQIGAGLPGANTTTGKDGARVIWAGPGQFFVVGQALAPIDGAAMVDHTSAWARSALQGADAAAVLARLVPVDLRETAFGVGATARTQLGHMACSLTRVAMDRFEIMVFRSMAATAVHELERAMVMVAARAALAG